MDDDVVIVNEGYEIRAGKVVVTVKSEAIAFNTNARSFGRGPAEAIAEVLRQKIRDIAAVAAPATLRYRQEARRAFERGAGWAMKRYAGGRMGPMPPNQTVRAFNDSGRLAKSIVAGTSDKDPDRWRVNVAANRFKDDTSGGFERMWTKLKQLVPEFGDHRLLLTNEKVQAAMTKSMAEMRTKLAASSHNLGLEVAKAALETAEAAAETAESLVGDEP